MDFDELLNLEQQFYQEGYEEGRNVNLRQNLFEGKQYGLQVGFQRFQLLGIIYGICDTLIQRFDDTGLHKNAKLIKKLIEDIEMNNNQESVAVYERSIFKIRNKFRLVLMSLQKNMSNSDSTLDRLTLEKVENLSREIAGEIQGYVEDNSASQSEITPQDWNTDW
ncbi:unnamed protein product [Kluyveromyces dobzhanskii CBS 2104]|uniref:WGS project CCBQ000000000 data, contig MAT n=1 Tax=Kluyveromyces dobzhanskii CBS 2104 TaxID=1427455 RepID=A0A0A8L3V0_9SACH|nr:unnamed protein product [Kluyveromyces dobzhanskii CBS 2104]